jgi:N-acetylmuramoyl-L-alanine amidase
MAIIKRVCIQAGHVNHGGGAPNELETNKRIVDRLCAKLRENGNFEVYQTDYYAYNDPKVIKTDWDLFLSCHCDMDYPNDGGSGFADYPEPSTDGATKESQKICKVINDYYFPEVKINYISHSNKNTRFYYMWKHLTAKTPCVLIEMGQSIDPHDKVLLGNTELIAGALYRAICLAFNISYETTPPVVAPNQEVEALKAEIKRLKEAVGQMEAETLEALAKTEAENAEKIKEIKKKIIDFVNSL